MLFVVVVVVVDVVVVAVVAVLVIIALLVFIVVKLVAVVATVFADVAAVLVANCYYRFSSPSLSWATDKTRYQAALISNYIAGMCVHPCKNTHLYRHKRVSHVLTMSRSKRGKRRNCGVRTSALLVRCEFGLQRFWDFALDAGTA